MNRYDVIVVGGGPSGSGAAYHLAKDGARVLVVDSSDVLAGRYKTCGGGYTEKLWWTFPPSSLEGIVEETITKVRVGAQRADATEHVSDRPIVYMSMRSNLDRELLTTALDSGADFRVARVEGVFLNGRPTIVLGGGERLTADHVVAADGANSIVTRSMGIPRHRRQVVAVEDEAYGQAKRDWSHTLEIGISASPIGYWWVFPKRDHLSTGFGASARVAKRIKRWAIDYTNRHVLNPQHNLTGHHITPRDRGYPAYRDGVFIVGDAGGFVDPCTVEGISWGALSGKYAANAILAGDPKRYLEKVEWFDREFSAARAFRNLLLARIILMASHVVQDSGFWRRFFRLATGDLSYQEWYRTVSPPMRSLAWAMNKLAPF